MHVLWLNLPCKWCAYMQCAHHQFYNIFNDFIRFPICYIKFSFIFSSQSGTYDMHNNISHFCITPTRHPNIKRNISFFSPLRQTYIHTHASKCISTHECKYCLQFHFHFVLEEKKITSICKRRDRDSRC